ncbi:DNA cytosine methyltransferase [Streptomyces diastatochromogenes]|nr:DNA cytosine methyltransferase [Streptomyces diastatochromogenes]
MAAGFPCTDISNAGHRKGIDGEKSRVWYNVAEAVRILRPRLLFLENVSAITRRGLDRVLGDLAAIGYDARWTCFRASEVGAAHHRDRWFCVAFPSAHAPGAGLESGNGQPTREDESAAQRGRLALAGGTAADGDASDTEGQRRPEGGTEPAGQQRTLYALAGGRSASPADTDRRVQQEHGQPEAGRDTVWEPSPPHAHGRCTSPPADAHSVRREGRRGTRPSSTGG